MLLEAGRNLDRLKEAMAEKDDEIASLNRKVELALNEVASKDRAIDSAVDHLKSYRYTDDHESLQHEVGMVITSLLHA